MRYSTHDFRSVLGRAVIILWIFWIVGIGGVSLSASERSDLLVPVQSNPTSFSFVADFMFWTARESGADCWAEVITTQGSASSNLLKAVAFDWEPGLRVGIGYEKLRDSWNTQAYYTRFHTQGRDAVSSDPGAVHSTFMGAFYVDNTAGAGITGPSYEKASIDWTLTFNMFDWNFNRNFHLSPALFLRFMFGIKGGWIDQFIDSKWINPDLTGSFAGAPFFLVGCEKVRNNFWGIGPQAGIETKWFLMPRIFALFGDFSGAIMWGRWSFRDRFTNDASQVINIVTEHINNGATTVRSLMGFCWDVALRQMHLTFKLGYESQFWLDQLTFYSFVGGRFNNILALQGGTFDVFLEF